MCCCYDTTERAPGEERSACPFLVRNMTLACFTMEFTEALPRATEYCKTGG
jgi:hypothetical protein